MGTASQLGEEGLEAAHEKIRFHLGNACACFANALKRAARFRQILG